MEWLLNTIRPILNSFNENPLIYLLIIGLLGVVIYMLYQQISNLTQGMNNLRKDNQRLENQLTHGVLVNDPDNNYNVAVKTLPKQKMMDESDYSEDFRDEQPENIVEDKKKYSEMTGGINSATQKLLGENLQTISEQTEEDDENQSELTHNNEDNGNEVNDEENDEKNEQESGLINVKEDVIEYMRFCHQHGIEVHPVIEQIYENKEYMQEGEEWIEFIENLWDEARENFENNQDNEIVIDDDENDEDEVYEELNKNEQMDDLEYEENVMDNFVDEESNPQADISNFVTNNSNKQRSQDNGKNNEMNEGKIEIEENDEEDGKINLESLELEINEDDQIELELSVNDE